MATSIANYNFLFIDINFLRLKSSVDNFSFIMSLLYEPPRQIFLLLLFALPYFMPYREQDALLEYIIILRNIFHTTLSFYVETQCLFAFAFYTLEWWKNLLHSVCKMATYQACYAGVVLCVHVFENIFIHMNGFWTPCCST